MGGDLFGDLPPPTYHSSPSQEQSLQLHKSVKINEINTTKDSIPLPPPPLKSALKSALKRPVPPELTSPNDNGSKKKLSFKTTTDASVSQIVEAMQKIASHIGNPAKFNKASKLAIQLIEAGSVKPETADQFFALLEAAMLSSTCNDASVRSDYHALFSAAQDAKECLNKKQKNRLTAWTIHAVVANDLFTDDSFVFSKAAGRIKDLISNLPVATKEEDAKEAAALLDEKERASKDVGSDQETISNKSTLVKESDPFGLDALISSKPKNIDKAKEKQEEEEEMIFLKLQREALINCLEIAAKRYKIPWCQTVIDILVKHAYDNVSRFTRQQRDAIGKLWTSIRDQHTRRKQGKSVSGKLDVTAFESLQEKYSNEKISIRRAVGGNGERRCQQWLG
ncbi:unnamed protein product [Amaranthus hypochondriacus]